MVAGSQMGILSTLARPSENEESALCSTDAESLSGLSCAGVVEG